MKVRNCALPGLFAVLLPAAMAALPATPITLTANANPATLGAQIALTASTTFGVTGKVVFYCGSAVIGVRPLNLDGFATLTTVSLPSGRNLMKAYYFGDATHAPAASSVLTLTVKALPAGNLHPAVAYGTGSGPLAIAGADFDGDGITDLALVTDEIGLDILAGNGVAIGNGTGTGDGSFRHPQVFPTGNNPVALVVSDFNADGINDIAVCNSASNTISVLLGGGGGSFHPAVNYNTGARPMDVVAADLNNDGKADLVVANADGGGLSILMGNGDGTFAAAVNRPLAGSTPSKLVVADLNGDGKPDLAVALAAGISIILGNGDGSFGLQRNASFGNGPYRFAVGDFNGDGKMDLAVLNAGDSNAAILLGFGNGEVVPAGMVAVGAAPQDIAVGDFDGDGIADLVVTSGSPALLTILSGKGDGTFPNAAAYNLTDLDPRGLLVGDFNNDGLTDIAITQHYFSSVGIMLGQPPVTAVTFQSNKPGVTIMVDGAPPRTTPFTLQLTRAVHTVSINPVQGPGNSYQYVFLNWSDNNQVSTDPASSHNITVTDAPATCEADVKTQYQLTMQVSPSGKGTVTPVSGGYYDPGALIPVTAVPVVGYGFLSWLSSVTSPVTNQASASTTATMANGVTVITAEFVPLVNATFQSTPPGALVSIDGNAGVPAPFTVGLVPIAHTVSAQHMMPAGEIGTFYMFRSWSDGGAGSHTFNLGTSPLTFTAMYVKQYSLYLDAEPVGGGTITVSPPTPNTDIADDFLYDADLMYTVTATPAPGYSFLGFTGYDAASAVSGTASPQSFKLTQPASIRAVFQPPNPVLSGAVSRSVTVQGQTVNLILTLTNSGLTLAFAPTVYSLTASVLSGTGSVSVAAPALPHFMASIPAGGSEAVPVQLTITGSVTRIKLTFSGNMQNTINTYLNFGGAAQAILP